MTTHRTGSLAAALALTAATTVAVAPAHAAPAPSTTEPGVVHYLAQGTGSTSGGSLDNELAQAGLLIVAGVAVSAALAIGAGIAGGAIDLPEIPGLPQ